MKCKTCRYFLQDINTDGFCRRYPPRGIQGYEEYLKVHWNMWCGEWKAALNKANKPDS